MTERQVVVSVTEQKPARMASEDVIIAAPISFAGSAQRIWKMTRGRQGAELYLLGAVAVTLIGLAWMLVLAWYFTFGILLLPFRLIRRGQRKANRQAAQHREQMSALERRG